MKFINEIELLKEFSAIESAASRLLSSRGSDSCIDGFELVEGRCIAVCPAASSDVLGAASDCMLPQANGIVSYFVFSFSLVVWCYVIYRMSLSRRLK